MHGPSQHTVKAALSVLLFLMIVVCARSETLLLKLPQTSTNGLPSDEFITSVNQALRNGADIVYAIPSYNQRLANYAKIILHSYGVTETQITFTNLVQETTPVSPKKNSKPTQPPPKFDTVFVVLGNRPLDDSTPTIDMVHRILTGVANAKSNPRSLLVLTGAPTEGEISEAMMMALIAMSRGIPRQQILLEEESWTTGRNAANTASLIAPMGISQIYVVSKRSHLSFAMPEFHKYHVFEKAQPLESPECTEESIAQMSAYLLRHNSSMIRNRIDALKHNSHGFD